MARWPERAAAVGGESRAAAGCGRSLAGLLLWADLLLLF
jgi:hypothetical protein